MKYLLLMNLFFCQLAMACSWNEDPRGGQSYMERLDQMIKEADYIFLGEVKYYERKINPDKKHRLPWHYHEIEALTQYKGKVEKRFNYWPMNSCYRTFSEVGSKYLFFGINGRKDGVQISEIGGTILASKAKDMGVLKILDDLRVVKVSKVEKSKVEKKNLVKKK